MLSTTSTFRFCSPYDKNLYMMGDSKRLHFGTCKWYVFVYHNTTLPKVEWDLQGQIQCSFDQVVGIYLIMAWYFLKIQWSFLQDKDNVDDEVVGSMDWQSHHLSLST